MDPTKLIVRAQENDHRAWEMIVEEHQEAVFRMAYLTLGDAAEAEDATQDAFVRAWRSLGGFDATRPIRPWLMRIVIHLSRNRQRSAGRYLGALRRSVGEVFEVERGVEGAYDAAEEAERLREAVQELRREYQEVVYLRHFLGMSIGETAGALGVREGTVKSRTSRALKRLAIVIKENYPELQDMIDG